MTESDRASLDALPLTVFLQLEDVCSRFEVAWQNAHASRLGPRIEAYLAPTLHDAETEPECAPNDKTLTAIVRPDVLCQLRQSMERELVRIDIAYRRRAGEAPQPEEYLARFPDLNRSWLVAQLAPAANEPAQERSANATPIPMRASTAVDAPLPPVVRMSLVLPARLDDYELLEEIARGGMGVVFKARQLSLDRIVALKMILPDRPFTPAAAARFHREARAAAALDHPNIVAVHASGEHNGRPYFTMAYIEGVNLRALVRETGLPTPKRAAGLLRDVAEAVACAHRQGIIHRDLKPENVLIDRNGRPRVTDFGLAFRSDTDTPGDRLTRMGEVLGTPAYMSPEQATAPEQAGPAADVYSLGAILYFLLTGQAPFKGNNISDVLVKVKTETPKAPREINPAASVELEAICLRCLEKDPARRYPSAEALAAALADTAAELKVSATLTLPPSGMQPASAERPHAHPQAPHGGLARWKWIALVAVALAALGGGTWWVSMQALPDNRERANSTDIATGGFVGKQPVFPKEICTDFGLHVEMLGGRPDGDAQQLKVGDIVQFRIKVDEDAYVGVWTVEADGTVSQLFPNADEPDHKFKRGQERVVPKTQVRAVLSRGIDYVWVQASQRSWDPKAGEDADAPFRLFQKERTERRGLRLVGKLSEKRLKYRVTPR